MPAQIRLYIVRHAETEWTHGIQGHFDVALSDTGLKQARLLAEALKDIQFARALSSDLQRASKTAECILQYHPDVVLELDEAIRERHHMSKLHGGIGLTNQPAPSMETRPAFTARCLAWYSRSIVDHLITAAETGLPADEPHNILVVSHGVFIMVLLSALRINGQVTCREDVEVSSQCLNAGVSIIEYPIIPTGKDEALVGTVVQYSGVQHLSAKGLHSQGMNTGEVEGEGKTEITGANYYNEQVHM